MIPAIDVIFELKLLQHKLKKCHINTYGVKPESIIEALQIQIYRLEEGKHKLQNKKPGRS